MTNFAHRDLESASTLPNDSLYQVSWWQRQGIRFKTTLLAIAIGTIPTLAIGSIAYYIATDSLEREISQLKKSQVRELQNQVSVFMSDRLKDVRVMANLDIFTHPQLAQQASKAEKAAALQKIQDAYRIYNSIAVFDLQGRVIAQTAGKPLGNHLNRSYVRAALAADGAIVSQPLISTTSGVFSIYTASPIKDSAGKNIGFVRARIPVTVLGQLLESYTDEGSQYYLLSDRGEVFLGSAGEYVIRKRSDDTVVADRSFDYEAITADSIFQSANQLLSSSSLATGMTTNLQTNVEQFLAYAPAKANAGLPQLNWQAIIAVDREIVFAARQKLRLVFILGSAVVAVGIGSLAYALAARLIRPILEAATAVQEIGRGNFTTRLNIPGTDEIAQLGNDINSMATRLADFVQVQNILTKQSESLKDIALKLTHVSDESEIFSTATEISFQTLKATRVVYYQIENAIPTAIAEFLATGQTTILHSQLDPELVAEYLERGASAKVGVINDVRQAELTAARRTYCQALKLKSCLIAPVIVADRLYGLLMVHQSMALPWLDEEVEFLAQVASQASFAVTRLRLTVQQQQSKEREQQAKEAMQMRALSLLQEVDNVAAGNLTVRAKVTEDEIGTIADSYNSTIESLQNLVKQTKSAASEVLLNTTANDLAVESLAAETIEQAEAIANMLTQIEHMETSIGLVANQAHQAEEFVQQATTTIAREDRAIDLTVAEIKAVQQTVTQTATKAEKLGESSQEISQAVNLISRFAAQTHLLALKASIEAARAGEQGKGFAVIADEVRSLATQSAEATAEIETLVSKIQLETGEVVRAMHQGAEQIASGNELVQQTRLSLTQVHQVSNEISQLVSSITQATQQQSVTSAEVSQTIVDVAAIAKHNSQSATQVSSSIRELSAIANKLQSNIAKFTT